MQRNLIWSGFCQLILGHICESKIGRIIAVDADLKQISILLTAQLYLCSFGLKSGHLKVYFIPHSRNV